MKQIIDQILEMHHIGVEIDKQIPSCGIGESVRPQWHIFGVKSFISVARNLNGGNFELKDRGVNGHTFRYELSFTISGVCVFCLTDTLEEISDEADRTD